MAPGVFDGALLGDAHPVLDLREGLLDRIEIGRVWRQEPEPGAGGVDGFANGLGFVAAQIIHDDDVSRLQCGHQLLLHIGQKTCAVDGPVEDIRGGEPICAQGTEEGHGAPAAVGCKAA